MCLRLVGKISVNPSDCIPMTNPAAMRNPAIDCILALGESDIPAQKIPPSAFLLAFTRAFKQNRESVETQEIPQFFVEEMREILAAPSIPDTHDIILATREAITELEEAGDRQGAQVLSVSLTILQAKFAREVQKN